MFNKIWYLIWKTIDVMHNLHILHFMIKIGQEKRAKYSMGYQHALRPMQFQEKYKTLSVPSKDVLLLAIIVFSVIKYFLTALSRESLFSFENNSTLFKCIQGTWCW